MEYVTLGLTELVISRIGFGCWAIGGHGYGIVDDMSSMRAICHAADLGINFFDTADVYGDGHSEDILGKALGSKRKDVVIATKFGVLLDSNGKVYKDISPNRVVRALEKSLRRLGIDCIPLYQIHWPDERTAMEDVMAALLKCRDAGKLRYIGCCNFSKDLLIKIWNLHKIESYQCLYNLARRQNEDIIRYASERLGMSVIAYSVLGRGVFSAKYSLASQFGKNDTRARDSDFYGSQYRRNISVAEELTKIGQKYGKTAAQVAIRWTLENPHITCALTGIKNCNQVSENIHAVGWSLDKNDMAFIDSILHD